MQTGWSSLRWISLQFQFLIGRVKIPAIGGNNSSEIVFQFLIGRVKMGD